MLGFWYVVLTGDVQYVSNSDVSARKRSISVFEYSGRRVAREGLSSPRFVRRSIVGADMPRISAVSWREYARRSWVVSSGFIVPVEYLR